MKIGINISLLGMDQQTGVGRVTEDITSTLIAEYPDVSFYLFAAIPRGNAARIRSLPWVAADNVRLTVLPLPQRVFSPFSLAWQRSQLFPVESFLGPVEIFHHYDWYVFPARSLFTATIFDLTPMTEPQWHTQEQVKLFQNWFSHIQKRAAHTFPISQNTHRDLIQLDSTFSQRSTVIHLGTDLGESFITSRLRNEVIRKLQLPSLFFLSVGTLDPRKNLQASITAFRTLRKSHPEVTLVVVGSRGWDTAIQTQLTGEGVLFLDYVPREYLPVLYQQAVALLYPSLYEGFGLPVLEALACGTLVITSFTSSLPEVGGEAVYYCDPYQPASIHHLMEKVLTLAPTKRRIRIVKGFRQAKQFTYTKSAQMMMHTWQSLLKGT